MSAKSRNPAARSAKAIAEWMEESGRKAANDTAKKLLEPEIKAKRRKSGLTGAFSTKNTPNQYLQPFVPIRVQMEAETWWFRLDKDARSRLVEHAGSSIRGLIVKAVLAEAERNRNGIKWKKKATEQEIIDIIYDIFIRYWFIFLSFSLLLVTCLVSLFADYASLPVFGLMLALFIMWQFRIAQSKRVLGVCFCCPITIMYVVNLYCRYRSKWQTGGQNIAKDK